MSNQPVSGRCLCGGVTFRLNAVEVSAHCHCRYCRMAHGAAFVTWIVVPDAAFALTNGETRVRWYQSSEQSRRGFCADCGSTMFFRSTLSPGETHVTRANITDPLDLPPKFHCFIDHKVDWVTIDDGIASLTSASPELRQYAAIPAGE